MDANGHHRDLALFFPTFQSQRSVSSIWGAAVYISKHGASLTPLPLFPFSTYLPGPAYVSPMPARSSALRMDPMFQIVSRLDTISPFSFSFSLTRCFQMQYQCCCRRILHGPSLVHVKTSKTKTSIIINNTRKGYPQKRQRKSYSSVHYLTEAGDFLFRESKNFQLPDAGNRNSDPSSHR